ncbi:MAG: hypothetical protein KGO96_12820 [Elusimicrobia bacterium]|nr:hypothetical protein [Elusimicrobiota bacterium]
MANAAGDIVTVLSLEDFEFRTGLRRAGREAKQAGSEIAGGIGRGIGQVGFAVQDFYSVFSMGGKNALGRALMGTMNNVQMLGAAFGPIGMAVTSIGGAIGAIVVPKLFEAKAASEEFTNGLKAAVAESEKLVSHFNDLSSFNAKLKGTKTSAGAASMLDDLDLQEKQLRFKRDKLAKAGNDFGFSLVNSGKAMVPDFAQGKGVASNLRFMRATAKGGGEGGLAAEREEAKKLADELDTLDEKLRDIRNKKSATRDKQAELSEAEQFSKHWDDVLAKQKKLREAENQRLKVADDIRQSVESPYEAVQRKLEDLKRYRDLGVIDDDLYGSAVDKAGKDAIAGLAKGSIPNQMNAGVAAGGGREYAAIRESIRSSQSNESPEAKAIRDLINLTRRGVKAQEELAAANAQPPIKIPGG